MTSLRERKKAQARERIVTAASRLFDSEGYESVTIRDIAAAAEVSYQTVYNYFPSKARILHEILLGEARSMEAQALAAFDPARGPWPGLEGAIDALVRATITLVGQRAPGYWRAVTAEILRDPDTFGSLMGLLDTELREVLAAALAGARARGELDGQVDLEVLAQVVIYLSDHAALRAISMPDADPGTIAADLKAQLLLVLRPYLR